MVANDKISTNDSMWHGILNWHMVNMGTGWVSNLNLVQGNYVVASGHHPLLKVLSKWIHVTNPLYTQCVANFIRLKGDCCY